MLGGRRGLPVLAEISGPGSGSDRVWSLRRADLESLTKLQAKLDEHLMVMVTGEERLSAAVGLAGAASAAGRRTALVECDLASPRLALGLGLAPAPGLHEYLRWEASAPQILQPLALAGPAAAGSGGPLVFIAAGRPAADAATLTGLESFRHALGKLRGAYDLVVVAGPALDPEDPALAAVAASVDALIAAVPRDRLSGGPRRRLRGALRRLPAPARGAILVAEAQPSYKS